MKLHLHRLSSPRALALLAVLAASALVGLTPGAARARSAASAAATRRAAAAASPATCLIRSLPSFIAQGESETAATAADIVELECNPYVYGTGSLLRITADQLFSRCDDRLSWILPNPFKIEHGRGATVALDADGNATVAVVAGPECQAGESLISAHMEAAPFETFTTSFTVLPPVKTTPGVFALPAAQVEDAGSSGVATIIQAEFAGGSEKEVHIGSEELFDRCRQEPKLHWIRLVPGGEGAELQDTIGPEVTGVRLDNDGNAFVIAVGDSSCAEGSSLIEADLESKPFTTFTTTFTTQPPQPTEEPSFTIAKLQKIRGSSSSFTPAPLTGALGQTVDYEIVVKNTGNVPETFTEFTDAHCDAGTLAGGPGSSPVPAGQTTLYTCDHVLTTVGSYTNEATVTGNTTDGVPVTQTSNQVEVTVPAEPGFKIEKLQRIAGSGAGFTTATLTGAIGQTVEYEIVVKNTGNEALTLSKFADPMCDPGTIAGGPGEAPLSLGSSTTYTCRRLLTAAGTYANVATVTGTPPGEMQTSNRVEVVVPGSGGSQGVLPGSESSGPAKHGVEQFCAAALPAYRVPSGPKRRTFTVQIGASGIRQITFYLDGHKLKSFKRSQAKAGKFSLTINPATLSYGPHTLSIKALPQNLYCAAAASAGVFVRPFAERRQVKFTG
jgi:uncharacterized repeat protein (TIGR01451 family)